MLKSAFIMTRSATRSLLPLIAALFALYFIWGSTYFVIRVGVESWPPLMMAGLRFFVAGCVMFAFLLLRGHKVPSLKQWLAAGAIGILLLAVGNGLVTVAEHMQVPSGIAAVMVATVPLFTLCFSRFWGMPNSRLEWTGVGIGLFGIVLLNTGSNLGGNPWGAVLILIASLSWAFGSVLSARLPLPAGVMSGAAQMIVAGVVLLATSYLSGERLTEMPSLRGFLAVGYLMIFGSMIAISAYMYLLKTVRPAIATSYAYVNPMVAVALGISFGGEWLSPVEWTALVVILCAVLLVTLGKFVFGRKPASIREVDVD